MFGGSDWCMNGSVCCMNGPRLVHVLGATACADVWVYSLVCEWPMACARFGCIVVTCTRLHLFDLGTVAGTAGPGRPCVKGGG